MNNTHLLRKSVFENSIDAEISEIIEITPDKNRSLNVAINDTSESARFEKSISTISMNNNGFYELRPYSMYRVQLKRKPSTTTVSFNSPQEGSAFNKGDTISVSAEVTNEI